MDMKNGMKQVCMARPATKAESTGWVSGEKFASILLGVNLDKIVDHTLFAAYFDTLWLRQRGFADPLHVV